MLFGCSRGRLKGKGPTHRLQLSSSSSKAEGSMNAMPFFPVVSHQYHKHCFAHAPVALSHAHLHHVTKPNALNPRSPCYVWGTNTPLQSLPLSHLLVLLVASNRNWHTVMQSPSQLGYPLPKTVRGGMFARTRPVHAQRATFVSSILSLAPSLSSPRGVPQVDRTRPQTFPARHLAYAEI